MIDDAAQAQATLWWRRHTPTRYQALLDALPLFEAPPLDTLDAWIEALESSETAIAPAQRQEYLSWLALGLLVFFNIGSLGYETQGGSPFLVRPVLDATLQAASLEARRLAEVLRSGQVEPLAWEPQMQALVNAVHLASGVIALGGWRWARESSLLRLDLLIEEQFTRLNRFVSQVLSGEQRLDGTLLRRAMLYVQAGRVTYHAVETEERRDRGYTQERSVLQPAEHCLGAGSCVEEASRGWVPLGELIPIGYRLCGANCRCFMEYR